MTPQDLIEYQQKHQMRRGELAALVGVTKISVWRWESGNRRIPRWLELFLTLKDRERSLTMALLMRAESITIKKAAAE